ncbi:MAG TPA: hypothetical protein V6D22_21240 [Candidatus Obscuribacterales bacterium]
MSSASKPPRKAPSVYSLSKASRCYNCDKKQDVGAIVKLQRAGQEDQELLCRDCAGLGTYIVLPAGNAAATKLAAKYSSDHYIIMKWSELWKCYERQGLLIDRATATRLEQELGIKIQD